MATYAAVICGAYVAVFASTALRCMHSPDRNEAFILFVSSFLSNFA